MATELSTVMFWLTVPNRKVTDSFPIKVVRKNGSSLRKSEIRPEYDGLSLIVKGGYADVSFLHLWIQDQSLLLVSLSPGEGIHGMKINRLVPKAAPHVMNCVVWERLGHEFVLKSNCSSHYETVGPIMGPNGSKIRVHPQNCSFLGSCMVLSQPWWEARCKAWWLGDSWFTLATTLLLIFDYAHLAQSHSDPDGL